MLGIGDTDVNGSLLPVTPRILSPRVSVRLDRESVGYGAGGVDGVGALRADDIASAKEVEEVEEVEEVGGHGRRGLVDARDADEAHAGETMSLPREFRGAIRLPYDLVGDVLSSKVAWEATFPHVKCPDTFTILVLLGENEEQECRAAARLNALGYLRSLCVKGVYSCAVERGERG